MSDNKKSDKKTMGLIIAVIVLAVALIGVLAWAIFREETKKENGESLSTSNEPGDNVKDGEIFDYESAGYMKLGTYKGLEAEVEPEDDDVYSVLVDGASSKDKVVENGDIVLISFTGKIDGKANGDLAADDQYVQLGKNQYIDDFEKNVIGMKVGDKKTFSAMFGKDYADEQFAGKIAEFTVELNGLFGKKSVSKYGDKRAKSVEECVKKERDAQLQSNMENKGDLVWEDLKDSCTFESQPQTLIDNQIAATTSMYTNFAEQTGTTVEDLLANFGMDEDGIQEIAQDTVKDIMICKTIAAKENLTLDDEFYKAALMNALGYSEEEEYSIEDLEKEYKEVQSPYVKDDMLVEKVKQFVGQNTNAIQG